MRGISLHLRSQRPRQRSYSAFRIPIRALVHVKRPEQLETNDDAAKAAERSNEPQLERGTYEIIQNRLHTYSDDLRERIHKLNDERREVFGSIPTELISTQRSRTAHNCTARDIVPVGDKFIFGYNVHMGLKTVTELEDVFSVYEFSDGAMHEQPLDLIKHGAFEQEFFSLYKYYTDTRFQKFHVVGPHLYMVFQVGKTVQDTKAFKFLITEASFGTLIIAAIMKSSSHPSMISDGCGHIANCTAMASIRTFRSKIGCLSKPLAAI